MEKLDESQKVLANQGLFVDDLSRIRVLDPETADASGQLLKSLYIYKLSF